MKAVKHLWLTLMVVMLPMAIAVAAPTSNPPKVEKAKSYRAGDPFCPSAVLVFGNIVVQSGRCYLLHVLRDSRGTFLAFVAPEAKIPPGQIVRLSTPAGAKVKGRIFYLVPIRASAALVPTNSVTLTAARVEDLGSKVSVTLTGTPVPNVRVIFSVRF